MITTYAQLPTSTQALVAQAIATLSGRADYAQSECILAQDCLGLIQTVAFLSQTEACSQCGDEYRLACALLSAALTQALASLAIHPAAAPFAMERITALVNRVERARAAHAAIAAERRAQADAIRARAAQ